MDDEDLIGAVAGDDIHYARIVQAFSQTCWALLPETLTAMSEVLAFRSEGGVLSRADIRARLDANGRQPVRAGVARSGSVAVIPMQGVISRRAGMFTEACGMVSLESFMAKVRAAQADDAVSAVVMAFDSPGGDAAAVHEAATELRSMRGQKPMVAVADGLSASGAYWLASQADEFVVSPSGRVGSIGVYTIHRDITKAQEQRGVKDTVIRAGKYKAETLGPLSEEAMAAQQELVNATYEQFVGDVAAGRGVAVAQVRNGFGEGRVVTAARAKELGMVDRIATLADTVARLQGKKPAPKPTANASLDARLARLRAAALVD